MRNYFKLKKSEELATTSKHTNKPKTQNQLREVSSSRQRKEHQEKRRWFSSPVCNVYVWYKEETISAFEYYYDIGIEGECVLIWSSPNTFLHKKVDDNNSANRYKGSDIIAPVNNLSSANLEKIINQFTRLGSEIDKTVYDFILSQMQSCLNTKSG